MCFSLADLFGIRPSEATTFLLVFINIWNLFDTMDSNLLQTLLLHWFLYEFLS